MLVRYTVKKTTKHKMSKKRRKGQKNAISEPSFLFQSPTKLTLLIYIPHIKFLYVISLGLIGLGAFIWIAERLLLHFI